MRRKSATSKQRRAGAKQGSSVYCHDLHSADPGRHFGVISAGRRGGGGLRGLFRRFEFDQVQGLSLPSSQ
jgi:hypothetical protein